MKRLLLACALLLASAAAAAQTEDVLGSHNLSAGTSRVRGNMANACLYCHVPHSGIGKGPLWGQTLSTQVYTLYSSDTARNPGVQPTLGEASTLCLSCHDGTVAPGQVVPYGRYNIAGTMTSILGTNLERSHPFSLRLPLQDAAHLLQSLVSSHTTGDPAVKLVADNVECTTCHNPHAQRTDPLSPTFLVRDNARGGLCLSCHGTTPRSVAGRGNPLVTWPTSVHAISPAQVSPTAGIGGYTTVSEYACLSCHQSHNAGAAPLLRNPTPPPVNIDPTSQSCLLCHGGGDKLVQPLLNVFAEFEKPGHPYASGSNVHSPSEPVVLENNRHTTCVDCHNAHAANQVVTFNMAPEVRPSQRGVPGVASDGTLLSGFAVNQFETCLRCHGASSGKQSLTTYGYLPTRAAFAGDPLNLIPQFNVTAVSAHPVMRDATGARQHSLRPGMLNLSGQSETRLMGSRIFCTDCHNSDNNREFGGTGPNGPHGSANSHILERRYEFSRVAPGAWPAGGPGSPIINLSPNPPLDPASGGPYSLCAKCHDLNKVMDAGSFVKHGKHVQDGMSCSVCHTPHGVPAGSAGLTGTRLVNFDVNVVAPNNGVLSYNGSTCTLTCHSTNHNPDGSVTPAAP